MSDQPQTPPHAEYPVAKPGTACLGCRRRKLKCSREEGGCSNCSKADLPCVYPAPDTSGVKRKRGPYKKDKPPRERHLEDLVKYLEPKTHATTQAGEGANVRAENGTATQELQLDREALGRVKLSVDLPRRSGNSEDLVKDALVALTKSHVEEQEYASDGGNSNTSHPLQSSSNPTLQLKNGLSHHPSPRRIFEYWHLYVSRVDPLLKVIHVPSFSKTFFSVIDDLQSISPVMEALLFSIYHISVSTCTGKEARQRFGEDRTALMKRYGRIIESTLADNYGMPKIESLQALVMYIISIRRDDSLANVKALFSLAVRMAQLIGLDKDPGEAFPPFEAEMRRRLWWHICGLESRGAEEGASRRTSIVDGTDVRFPSNLNDTDLTPDMPEYPQSRTGITDVTWLLVRSDIFRLIYDVKTVNLRYMSNTPPDGNSASMKTEQKKVLDEGIKRFETEYLRYLHPSRPYDWLCIAFIEGMLIKCRLQVTHPTTLLPTRTMTPTDRSTLLQSSVSIIRLAHACASHRFTSQWAWFFRGWMQWHCIAVVIAELGGNKNEGFVREAWRVLDPILVVWDKVYERKREEPAWEHVNAAIERARGKRAAMEGGRVEKGRKEVQQQQQQQQEPTPMETPQQTMPHSTEMAMGNLSGSTAPWTGMNGIWQTNWNNVPDASTATVPAVPQAPSNAPSQFGQQYFSPPAQTMTTNVPFQTGCAPLMPGMEMDFNYNDFSFNDGLEGIDFSAFEGVFGDGVWDFSPPSTELTMDGMGS